MATVNLGFENNLWDMADKLRGNIEASEYKHVVLGLIFLKYISDSFEERYDELVEEGDGFEEDIDAYTEENVFFVPQEARWDYIKSNAKQPTIGQVIDEAMLAIEKENAILKGVLPKNYAPLWYQSQLTFLKLPVLERLEVHKPRLKDCLRHFLKLFVDLVVQFNCVVKCR